MFGVFDKPPNFDRVLLIVMVLMLVRNQSAKFEINTSHNTI